MSSFYCRRKVFFSKNSTLPQNGCKGNEKKTNGQMYFVIYRLKSDM